MRQLLEVAREERERGNDGAKDRDVRSDHQFDIVGPVIGEEVFKSIKALIHFAANYFELKVYGIESLVNCIKPTV